MHADFTNQRKGKAARLTDGTRALGTAIAKMGGRLVAWVDAWLLALAHPVPAVLMPVCLRSGWMGWTVLPPAPAPSAGAKPLLNPAAASLVRPYPDEPPARHRTSGRRAALRPATLRPSLLRGRRAPLETRDLYRVSRTGSLQRKRRYHDAVGQSWLRSLIEILSGIESSIARKHFIFKCAVGTPPGSMRLITSSARRSNLNARSGWNPAAETDLDSSGEGQTQSQALSRRIGERGPGGLN